MGLLEKVKNFFYEEDIEEDIEPIKEPKHSHKDKKEKQKFSEIKEENYASNEISERELFKAERTFNFPMDIDDEDGIKVEKEQINNIEVKAYKPKNEYKENAYTGIRNYARYEDKKEEREPVKKFKPTPVISPIYGILDKNYKKEDLIIDSTNKYEPERKVDYDSVRKRAYGNVYSDDQEDEIESKGIFFNLDEEAKDDESDVKIIYNDVTLDEEESDTNDENVTIGEKIKEYEESKADEQEIDYDDTDDINYDDSDDTSYDNEEQDDEDDQILSETKEQDLFNLIDNMYNSDENDEEDE